MTEVRQRRRIVEHPGGYEVRRPPEGNGAMLGTLLGREVPTRNGVQAWAPSGSGFILLGTFENHNEAGAKLEAYQDQIGKAKAAHAKAGKQRGKK